MRKIVEYAETAHKEVAFIPVVHYEKETNVSSKASVPAYYFLFRHKSTDSHRQTKSRSERSELQKNDSGSESS